MRNTFNEQVTMVNEINKSNKNMEEKINMKNEQKFNAQETMKNEMHKGYRALVKANDKNIILNVALSLLEIDSNKSLKVIVNDNLTLGVFAEYDKELNTIFLEQRQMDGKNDLYALLKTARRAWQSLYGYSHTIEKILETNQVKDVQKTKEKMLEIDELAYVVCFSEEYLGQIVIGDMCDDRELYWKVRERKEIVKKEIEYLGQFLI